TYIVGACANGVGGFISDWLVRRYGLARGRRTLGMCGLGAAAIFMTATLATTSGAWALVFLSLACAGILIHQPNLGAGTPDTGKAHAGAVFGFMNMTANGASVISSTVFGYLVSYSGSYNAPLLPMATFLCLGVVLWWKIDPAHDIFAPKSQAEIAA